MGGVIATYSTGPVAIGDGIGFTNVELVLRSCTAITGTLLQPSRPATAIDACFFQAAFGSSRRSDKVSAAASVGPIPNKPKNYPVWSTHTAIAVSEKGRTTMRAWTHVFALHLKKPFGVLPSHLPLDVDTTNTPLMIQWTGWGASSNVTLGGIFGPRNPIKLPACAAHDFQLHHAAPVFLFGTRGIALLGEPAKWVPVASRRIASVTVYHPAPISSSSLDVVVTGDPGEEVELAFAEVTIDTMVGVAPAAGAPEAAATSPQVNKTSSAVLSVKCKLSAIGRAVATMYLRIGSVPVCK
jgi:hypothetical protein